MTEQSAYDKIQLNGVCWDCGSRGATADVLWRDGQMCSVRWRCRCGRTWAVSGADEINWLKARVKVLIARSRTRERYHRLKKADADTARLTKEEK